MRVIKKGEPAKVWPREIETLCCKSILELDAQDIKTNTDYLGDFSSYFIDCPVCGAQPDVPGPMGHEAKRWIEQQTRRTGV